MLHKEPDHTVAVVLHAAATGATSRAVWHGNIARSFVAKKCDCDTDITIQYTRANEGNHQTLSKYGWLVFAEGHVETNVFARSKLMLDEAISGLSQMTVSEMDIVCDVQDANILIPGSCSVTTRTRYCSEETYKAIVQLLLQGANLPLTRDEKKGVAVAAITPWNGAVMKAILALQTQGCRNADGPDMALDIRCVAFEKDKVI